MRQYLPRAEGVISLKARRRATVSTRANYIGSSCNHELTSSRAAAVAFVLYASARKPRRWEAIATEP